MEQYVIIHGHFYQPPRENPWLQDIEIQDSAFPYHDWNERITAECYAPNAYSRLLDNTGKILAIVNNYEKISFNFGPTLIRWLEKQRNDIYKRILDADRNSMRHNSGHGNAIAQVYNHIILPLATDTDKETQIIWGIEDFKMRFCRVPEGMWLSETAVNKPTLRMLVKHKIKFIILSPYQAWRVRPIGDSGWRDVSDGCINTSQPYRCYIDGDKDYIDIFFYNASLSRKAAFEHLLRDAVVFGNEIEQVFEKIANDKNRLIVICTDGESYGHHEPFGDMCIAYLSNNILPKLGINLVNFGYYLERFPPVMEVEIKEGRNEEGTSWSCSHGVDRWKDACGCTTGSKEGWHQRWRKPMRGAMDMLKKEMDAVCQDIARNYITDLWDTRDNYIKIINNNYNEDTLRKFIACHEIRKLEPKEVNIVIKIMELQLNLMYMYTSCGWFFADISGIEAVQNLKYACRALKVANSLGIDNISSVEKKFLDILESAESNIKSLKNGKNVYKRYVLPSVVPRTKIVFQFFLDLIYKKRMPTIGLLYYYKITPLVFNSRDIGDNSIVIWGKACLYDSILHEDIAYNFIILSYGKAEVFGYIVIDDKDSYEEIEMVFAQIKSASHIKDIKDIHSSLDASKLYDRFTFVDILHNDIEKYFRFFMIKPINRLKEIFKAVYDEYESIINLAIESSFRMPDELLFITRLNYNDRFISLINSYLIKRTSDIIGNIDTLLENAENSSIDINKGLATPIFNKYIFSEIEKIKDNLRQEPLKGYKSLPCLSEINELEFLINTAIKIGIPIDETRIQNEIFFLLTHCFKKDVSPLIGSKDDITAYNIVAILLNIARLVNINIDDYKKALAGIEKLFSDDATYWP